MVVLRSLTVAIACFAFAACSNDVARLDAPPPVAPTPVPPAGSVGTLKSITTIASTVDPLNGDRNPYGLAIAPVTAGLETAGDLIVCNFSDKANVNGNGTTIEDINPTPGSTPKRLAQSPSLAGCNAIAMAPNGNVWAADYTANNNPIVGPDGIVKTTLAQGPWAGPWGQAFNTGTGGKPAFFVTNAKNGTVIRININPGPTFTFDTILTGLTYNGGVPGNILAPAGLTYDKGTDTLFIVDSNANRVIRVNAATTAPANTYAATGTTFNTPMVATVFAGAPLAAPISMAQLANGDLVVGNTAATSLGNNVLVEINPTTQAVVASVNVDPGAAGALFGIAATTIGGAQYVYFNDDNDNTVKSLSP
ncbi:MAG: hypothetical protein NVSMB59_21760 [Vulcanimicrobiaceae bacterium]